MTCQSFHHFGNAIGFHVYVGNRIWPDDKVGLENLELTEVEQVQPGDIIVLAGIKDVTIGDTIYNELAPP